SGRENIYTNAAIFGLTKHEIDARLDKIVEFSELEEFIDNPVRTYSSGMYMRLAFSVAINVDADILLIDEILAVGDANFQAKCFNKLREIKSKGTTIVIVSHSLGQIEQICDRSVWIHEGLIKAEGDPKEIDLEYLDFMGRKMQENAKKELSEKENSDEQAPENNASAETDTDSSASKNRWENGKARIEKIRSYSSDGSEQKIFRTGESIIFKLDYTVKERVEDAVFGIGIFNRDGVQCYGTNTRIDQIKPFSLEKSGSAEIVLDDVMLLAGEYILDFAIESGDGIPVDYYRGAFEIQMISNQGDVGIARIDHKWKLK
ncbi:MAG: Wzt carbohydrate-binding domain-containing protein, partial [Ruminococcus flavefaciens]|nr:Wzt carbohydrate-binding domain-containing protein [Ruminococcus flavefaciens]